MYNNSSEGSGVSGANAEQRSAMDAAAKSLIPGFGVVLFDNPKDMSDGWACRAGSAPFMIRNASELSNDTMWITSLAWDEYQMRAKKLSHLRRIDYLRSSLTSVAADLGRRIDGAYTRESCEILAKIFQQTMLIAIYSYQWQSPSNDLRGDVLSDDIRRALPAAPKTQPHIRAALMSAYQSYSSPDWPYEFEPDTVTINMRYNRLDYASKIMATRVPDDAWTYIPPEQACKLRIDELLNPQHPCLVEAAVELSGMHADIATLIAFGAQTTRRTGLRKWISQPELQWLSRHAKVRVSSVLMAKSARALSQDVMLPQRLVGDPLFSLSLSAGLVAESHWSSIAATIYNRTTKNNDVSSWAVWLRAMDRSLSFSLALKAHQAGFKVTGYGNGSIVLRVSRSSLPACLDFADQNDICHPAFDALFKEHGVSHE